MIISLLFRSSIIFGIVHYYYYYYIMDAQNKCFSILATQEKYVFFGQVLKLSILNLLTIAASCFMTYDFGD